MSGTPAGVQRMVLGDVEVIRIVEWSGGFPADVVLPDTTVEQWQDATADVVPDHWDPGTNRALVAIQTWVLRSAGQTVVVDTGVGDGRERPESPHFHHWRGGFLGLLSAAGIRPEDVDVVVNTHLHVDHVGWNTVPVDGGWQPTFPRARYLMPEADDRHLGARADGTAPPRGEAELLYRECIEPVHRAGQSVLWDGEHRIDANLLLESAPGHTPGSAVLRLASAGDRAVFVGDLVHTPMQVLHPSCRSGFCLDPALAARSRHRVLGRAADEGELVVPAHFCGPGALEVRRGGGDAFAFGDWAVLAPD